MNSWRMKWACTPGTIEAQTPSPMSLVKALIAWPAPGQHGRMAVGHSLSGGRAGVWQERFGTNLNAVHYAQCGPFCLAISAAYRYVATPYQVCPMAIYRLPFPLHTYWEYLCMYSMPVGSYSTVLRAASAYRPLSGCLHCRRYGRDYAPRFVVTVQQPLWLS